MSSKNPAPSRTKTCSNFTMHLRTGELLQMYEFKWFNTLTPWLSPAETGTIFKTRGKNKTRITARF